jgi:opacity protein-like surface antigen
LQLYGAGGMAYGGVTSSTALFTRRAAGANITNATASNNEALIGWTAGGGVEWMFMPNWSVKAEYLHYDLGAARAWAAAIQPGGFYAYAVDTRTTFDGNLVQAGVSRHFDMAESVAATPK